VAGLNRKEEKIIREGDGELSDREKRKREKT
jgi:hypothetical protein